MSEAKAHIFDTNYQDYLLPLKAIHNWLVQLRKKRRYVILSESDFILSPSDDLTAAASHESFKKLLDFLLITQHHDDHGDVVWKLDPAHDPTAEFNSIAIRANDVEKLIHSNIPEEETFFDLDLQGELPELKILKQFLEKTMKELKESICKVSIRLDQKTISSLMEKRVMTKLLFCLSFEPPFEKEVWRIPPPIPKKAIREKLDFVTRIFHLTVKNDDICKGCKQSEFRNILLHLKKSQPCSNMYSEEEIEDKKAASKYFSKIKAWEWQKANKDQVAKRKAEHYQLNKETIKTRPKDKEKRKESNSKYYKKNQKKVAETKAAYYQKNKEKTIRNKIRCKRKPKV